ncbi:MAG: CRISPR-associated protein Cas2 [Candidatus Methanomethylophilaceae archaeon]|nr:CRISPR-associated protein Cas2 [Candidatus Methanomethylophilaceae archaeon]
MIVISLINCPPSLRGDLTKWLFEVSTNVFVGRTSARVRDEIWDRVVKSCKNGRAVMVFGADNEQRFDFRVHNGEWEPVDLNGLKIMRRPPPENQEFIESKFGYSKASKYRKISKIASAARYSKEETRIFVSITATGVEPAVDRITSIGSIAVKENHIIDTFLWTLPNDMDCEKDIGCDYQILSDFFDFLGDNTVIFDDINLSLSLIELECNRCGIEMDIKEKESIRSISKKRLYDLRKHDLKSLQEYYGIRRNEKDVLSECRAMAEIYNNLTKDK